MMRVKLYLDENVPEAIATALRLRGYDVTTTKEAGKKAASDSDQLRYATSQKRVLFTFNVADFAKLHDEFLNDKYRHSGIIISRQLPIGTVVKRLLKMLSRLSSTAIENNIFWLSE
jgi:predicted nuclease of predicted toxin-antitoxin system